MWEENCRLRTFLKFHLDWSDRKLDSLVHEVARSVAAEIDCTQCANCCRAMSLTVGGKELARLARRLGVSNEECKTRMKQIPCPFLDGNLCTIYEERPKECRDFPHLHKSDMRSRSIALVENAERCPIVFNTLQRLKTRLGWTR